MTTATQALIMLLAGIGVPLLAALNAALGKHIAAPATAALVLFAVAVLCTLTVTALTGWQGLTRLTSAPWHFFLAGGLVAFYVLSITWIAPRFGVGNAVFFVLIGQLISAAAIDHFGLFGASQQALTLTRAAGIGLMGLGVLVTQLA